MPAWLGYPSIYSGCQLTTRLGKKIGVVAFRILSRKTEWAHCAGGLVDPEDQADQADCRYDVVQRNDTGGACRLLGSNGRSSRQLLRFR